MDTIEKVYCTGHDIAELLLPDAIEHYQDGLRESTWAEGHR